jgi:cold shock CspA family protein
MKYFGTVKSFDTAKGFGEIKQEAGGDDLQFDKAAISWGNEKPPTVGQRHSNERGANNEPHPRPLNLQTI